MTFSFKLYRLVRSQPLESPKRTDRVGGVKVGCSDAREAVGNAQLLAVVHESRFVRLPCLLAVETGDTHGLCTGHAEGG